MSTPNPTLLDKSGTVTDGLEFSAFGKATLQAATTEELPVVKIPPAVAEYLADEVTYFAGTLTRKGERMTNRVKETLHISPELAMGILTYRPADRKLTGQALTVAGAKEFARQIRQYATDHKLSTAPSRTNASVTFRIVKPQPAKPKNGPVTVTSTK